MSLLSWLKTCFPRNTIDRRLLKKCRTCLLFHLMPMESWRFVWHTDFFFSFTYSKLIPHPLFKGNFCLCLANLRKTKRRNRVKKAVFVKTPQLLNNNFKYDDSFLNPFTTQEHSVRNTTFFLQFLTIANSMNWLDIQL